MVPSRSVLGALWTTRLTGLAWPRRAGGKYCALLGEVGGVARHPFSVRIGFVCLVGKVGSLYPRRHGTGHRHILVISASSYPFGIVYVNYVCT
jgi:hypothetical protein